MAIVKISKSDLKRGELVPEGWYEAEFKEFSRKPNVKKTGINMVCVFTVTDSEGDERETTVWFPEKWLGKEFILFYSAMTGEEALTEDGGEFDSDMLKATVGNKLWVEVKHEIRKDTGKPAWRIVAFLPRDADDPRVFNTF
jgi:hypothetical protein